ncbi:hypothetical protein K7G19_06430 [Cupriavidus sp. DB3]|uniref:hypothetical protein n=1 Tax=Cupriavidus sp. DB3 TaxID=2873259 RepID=UPI001CF17CAF|nr:hypothetical protein [Cupriavidus sp. DB3]MCA7083239.1 hypothetical protein [Cupriavidus sp. DB3]
MSNTANKSAPGGLTWGRFQAICADVGSWTWGTVKGAFNEKATFSQIIVDAVIGMIPLLGDVTAARDIIAVTIGLVDDPKKREDVWEWVLLVVLIVALIPVVGGVVKGVGRLVVKLAKEGRALEGAARSRHVAEAAADTIAFLNRIGTKNAEQWLGQLSFKKYQAEILERFSALMNRMHTVLGDMKKQAGAIAPASLLQRVEGIRHGIKELADLGNQMIPKAIKELDQQLREMQAFVRSGGETTSRKSLYEVAAGERGVTRADETRLVEGGTLPARSARGWKPNPATASTPKKWKKYYQPEDGYPNLTMRPNREGIHTAIAAFSGRMVNRQLKEGEEVFRLFGPAGVTHKVNIAESAPGGIWWGIGKPPNNAKEWRELAAVLDEFNRDGYMVVGRVTNTAGPKSVVGTVAEQAGERLPGQYLPGGATQAVFFLDSSTGNRLKEMGQEVISSGKPSKPWEDPISGITFEVRPTGWVDTNGVWGYLTPPNAGTVQTARLGAREQATKDNREVTIAP